MATRKMCKPKAKIKIRVPIQHCLVVRLKYFVLLQGISGISVFLSHKTFNII